jgi:hypothetical protein
MGLNRLKMALKSHSITMHKNLPKNPRQKPAKNPLKIPQPKIQQKSFMISLTKNPIKI